MRPAPPDPKFYRRNGDLTSYALACGYIETRENLLGESFRLWREASTYHVTGFDGNGCRVFWESFGNRFQAYKFFRTAIIPPEMLKIG